MRFNFSESKIYVRPRATDLRKGVSGLCAIIANEMNLDAEGCKGKRIIERSIATPSLLAHVFTLKEFLDRELKKGKLRYVPVCRQVGV